MAKDYLQKISSNVKASYSQFATEFDHSRQMPWPEFDHFLAYTHKHAKVLDLGCGNGRLCQFLEPKKVDYLGIDHNSHLLEVAKANCPEAHFELADMMELALEEEAFDNVFCIAAFHHIPTRWMRKKVLEDIYKSLRPDGILILTTWNLFQLKYLGALLKSILRCILTLGLKGSWNDLYIPWHDYPIKRYYHSFLPRELNRYFDENKWIIEEFYFTRKGKRVSWLRSYNLVLIVRKK